MHMIHHISFSVSNLKRSAEFYDKVLSPLGYKRVCETESFVGYGTETGKDKFAIASKNQSVSEPSPGFHLAFSSSSKEGVDKFFEAALEFGGTDNGKPGLRPQYGPNYYAAFIIDPDGYHIEAVINEASS